MNINIFSHERQWIQLATILLIAAFTKFRSEVLLEIIYQDLNLFIQRDKIIKKVMLTLQLKLIRIKSCKKRKRSWVTVRKLSSSIWLVYSKIYTFFIDTNSFFCAIFHIISLICNNNVYLALDLILKKVLMLSVQKKLNCQLISWKENVQDVSVFHLSMQTTQEFQISFNMLLLYNKYHDWVKRLKKETDFEQVFTIYCIQQATRNVINNESWNFWFKTVMMTWSFIKWF